MARKFGIQAEGIRRILADRLLLSLILGVFGAALFATVMGADATLVFGVLVIGCVTAFIESAHYRNKKP